MESGSKTINCIVDSNVGTSFEKVFWCHRKDDKGTMFWCRAVISIMGSYNTSEEYRKKHSPFEPKFKDNFVEGKGRTKEEALNNMKTDLEAFCEAIWF